MHALSNYNLLKSVTHLFILFLIICLVSKAQDASPEINKQEAIVSTALEMMRSFNYCALITLDETGQPQARTMNPYPQEEDMIIWFATKRGSRKLDEIKNDPRVNVYYSNHDKAVGYVSVCGNAEIIDDKEYLLTRKREYWEGRIKDWQNTMVLIKIIPDKIDIINYEHGLTGDPITSRSPSIIMNK